MSDATAGQGSTGAATEFRIARYSAVSALLGALPGGGATLLAAQQQIASEAETQMRALRVEADETRAEFLRQHRVEACAAILKADRELSSEEGQIRTWLQHRVDASRAEVEFWDSRVSRMQEFQVELFRANDSIELLGTEAVKLAAQRLLAGHTDHVNALVGAFELRKQNSGARAAESLDEVDGELRGQLIEECRDDASATIDRG